ncbi:P-loop containing nucleoside triphosphate hydrolase protein [Mycena epipterygia]|nr:P-loop containing nucleoside triphosphate hydrolase protein [Mycena epipterygia]
MPPTSTVTETRLDNIVACLTSVIPLLNEFSDAFGIPFVPAIANTTLSLITLVQNVKKNKEECIQLMENVHELLYAVVNLHMKARTASSLPPATLSAFGELTETLHKVYAFIEAQQDGSRIKHFFRQSEMKTLLKECHIELQQAVDVFKMKGYINLHGNIIEMQKEAERIHKELLESISTSSDATISDRSSSVYIFPQKLEQQLIFEQIHHWPNGLHNSSNSISMLPAKPKIFYGRESELREIVKILNQDSARIAILGAGGMGKTSLAKAGLHHPDMVSKYYQQFFVAAGSATTSIELAALIGLHIGLKPGKDLTKSVVQYFSNNGSCLLVLDNLETLWEPMESRSGVEELLSRLTDLSHLALVITMRGAERPEKVRWTRPFLQPLEPLSDDAARQTFVAIAEDFHDNEDITKLLSLTDNMPLAVDLIAHLVDHEGCEYVLTRWATEKTSLLSSGHDRRSNLDISITVSLSSPRLSSGAKDLLSLLSILPDGLSDAELLHSKLPIKNILECRSMLLRTSLAYVDARERLKSLVPIREHMQQFYPAPSPLVHKVEKHFHLLLDVYKINHGSQQVNQIISNLGNLHQVLLRGLQQDNPTLADTISCAIALNIFSRAAGYGRHVLMNHIPAALSAIHDDRLEVLFIIEVFGSRLYHPIATPEQLIAQAIHHFGKINDLLLEFGEYSFFNQGNISRANQYLDKALVLSKSCGNKKQQAVVLTVFALMLCATGDYPAAKIHAHEIQRLSHLSADLYTESYALRIEALCAIDFGDYKSKEEGS